MPRFNPVDVFAVIEIAHKVAVDDRTDVELRRLVLQELRDTLPERTSFTDSIASTLEYAQRHINWLIAHGLNTGGADPRQVPEAEEAPTSEEDAGATREDGEPPSSNAEQSEGELAEPRVEGQASRGSKGSRRKERAVQS